MTQVYSKALQKTTSLNRIIGKIEGDKTKPTIVFFGGIHGNETSGIFALQEVFKTIESLNIEGNIYGLSGNLKALELNKRFIDEDLNRIWTHTKLNLIKEKGNLNTEEQEQAELFEILKEILIRNSGPFYFIDFHTTSSRTLPFITINDALINRKFSKQFPVPIVLGIEEYLNGPLLSYINELGYVSLGFESGQHDEENAITNHISFAYLAFAFTKILCEKDIPDLNKHYNSLKRASENETEISEVVHLHKIQKNETFKMLNGFKSFQNIKKGTKLAISNNQEIVSEHNATLFMPLYQEVGDDGFFIIRKIRPFFLGLSAVLRRFEADNLLVLLPGITWEDKRKHVLQVNLKVAKFLAKPIFHLLGYRNKKIDATHVRLYNRERVAKKDMYKKEDWFKRKCFINQNN